jgi:hypothetical protein
MRSPLLFMTFPVVVHRWLMSSLTPGGDLCSRRAIAQRLLPTSPARRMGARIDAAAYCYCSRFTAHRQRGDRIA